MKPTIDTIERGMDVIYTQMERRSWVSSFIISDISIPLRRTKVNTFKGKVLRKIRNYSAMFPDDVLVCIDSVYEEYKDLDICDILEKDENTYAIRSIGQLTFTEPNKTNTHLKKSLKDWGDNA